MAKVSILMPAYNAEKYIHESLNSIWHQSYDDWEIIIVDDCSTDYTVDICQEFIEKDKRFKLYRNDKNYGISKNKNRALSLASGKYIAFCDDDDTMNEHALRDNLKLAEDYNADVVRWSYKTIKVNDKDIITDEVIRKCTDGVYLSKKEIFSEYENVHELLSCDWTGLYKKNVLDINGIGFNEEYKFGGEDTSFNIQVLKYVNTMVINSSVYYTWYLRKKHSTTSKRNINFCYSMMEVARDEYYLLKDNCKINIWEKYAKFYQNLILDYAKALSPSEILEVNNALKQQEWVW